MITMDVQVRVQLGGRAGVCVIGDVFCEGAGPDEVACCGN